MPTTTDAVIFGPGTPELNGTAPVINWQRFLVKYGISVGPTLDDGKVGPSTAAATRTFQSISGLSVDANGNVKNSTINYAASVGYGGESSTSIPSALALAASVVPAGTVIPGSAAAKVAIAKGLTSTGLPLGSEFWDLFKPLGECGPFDSCAQTPPLAPTQTSKSGTTSTDKKQSASMWPIVGWITGTLAVGLVSWWGFRKVFGAGAGQANVEWTPTGILGPTGVMPEWSPSPLGSAGYETDFADSASATPEWSPGWDDGINY